jgi:hypothetical protein
MPKRKLALAREEVGASDAAVVLETVGDRHEDDGFRIFGAYLKRRFRVHWANDWPTIAVNQTRTFVLERDRKERKLVADAVVVEPVFCILIPC